jgi:hypothetical protein
MEAKLFTEVILTIKFKIEVTRIFIITFCPFLLILILCCYLKRVINVYRVVHVPIF